MPMHDKRTPKSTSPSTIYKLRFKAEALKEWHQLDRSVATQFKKKLRTVLDHPHIAANRLSGGRNLYKIKLRTAGFRLVYEVRDKVLVVIVIAVGKRDRNAVYRQAMTRLDGN